MNRRLAGTFGTIALVTTAVIGLASPAQADSIVIPGCATMLDRSTLDLAAHYAGGTSMSRVAESPTLARVGSAVPTVVSVIRSARGTNCTWQVTGNPFRHFTMSETRLNSSTLTSVRWALIGAGATSHVGVAPSIIWYVLPSGEVDVILSSKVLISVVTTSVPTTAYVEQDAYDVVFTLNPGL
ncbi:MAG: hypothetical protein ABI435_04330 [Pseudolysinimonas sp.]